MGFFWFDFGATFGSVLIFLVVVLGGGALFARLLRFPGFDGAAGLERAGQAMLCGFACLPVSLDLAGRLGVAPMAAAAGLAAAAGAPIFLRGQDFKPSRARIGWLLAILAWIVVAIVLVIDWPEGAGLFHSKLAFDYVKHAEATWSIAQSGTPPWNPTFFTPGAKASYYYFFYTLTAVVDIAAGALFGAGARHAAYAGGIVIFLALPPLMHELWRRSGVDEAVGAPPSKRSASLWIGLLLLSAGLDLIEVAKNLVAPSPIWTEQITPWLLSALWVPQHVAALIAAFVGFMALARPAPFDLRRTLLAALAFASTAGLSVYVALAAALAAALWLIALLARRRAADAANLVGAGLGAGALAAPWLTTLAGRMADKPPIGFAIRNHDLLPIAFASPAEAIPARLAVMILIYFMQFGVFALGAYAFWRQARRKGVESDIGLILVLSTVSSFLLGSFLYSTMLNNDLGWRVMLFAQSATLVWTLAAIRANLILAPGRLVTPAAIFLAMGFVYVLVMAQYQRYALFGSESARALTADARAAWLWLDRRLPAGTLVQAQPDVLRSIDFGLYGRFPTPIADRHVGQLFGASESAVNARIAEMEPIFSDRDLPLDKVTALAQRRDLAAIVVTSDDPVFDAPAAWTARMRPAFANPHVRVYLMKDVSLAGP